VFNDLRNRGVEDILIAVVDGLKGFPQAIEAAFPKTTVQTCIAHLMRNSLSYVGWKDRKFVAAVVPGLSVPRRFWGKVPRALVNRLQQEGGVYA
jgi:transposase-like protein